jgi:hypothetical protein
VVGEELYAVKDIYVEYPHRSLRFYPSGPNMKVLRGKSRIFGGIDEYYGTTLQSLSMNTNIIIKKQEKYSVIFNKI